MAVYLSPIANDQVLDSSGAPLVGGYWEVYLAGTTTPKTTYTSSAGTTPQAAQITLDASGRPANPIWLTGGVPVKFRLFDSVGAVLLTLDNISGVNDPSAIATADQWITYSGTPTYISATSFSVPGDQTAIFQVNRRVRTTNTGGVRYSTISASVYGSVTTVTVVNDSGTLDAGLSDVAYGIIGATSTSVPDLYALKGANTNITSLAGVTGIGNTANTHLQFSSAGRAGFNTNAYGFDGVSLPTAQNFGWSEAADSALAVSFRQASSAAYAIGYGVKYSANANAFASSYASSVARSAVAVGSDSIKFYANSAATVAVGTDVSMIERRRITSSGESSVVPGGSTLYPDFACRAWVYFNGSGTPAPIASGNVTSITDNGVGDYTVNFTTNMPDANYAVVGSAGNGDTAVSAFQYGYSAAPGTSSCRVSVNGGFALVDRLYVSVAFFR